MKFKIEIDVENAAFTDGYPYNERDQGEIARILDQVVERLRSGGPLDAGHARPLFDINGNDVGYFGFTS